SNNVVKGRISNLGEWTWGDTSTAVAGDMTSTVANALFPWALNGYTSISANAGAVYGYANGTGASAIYCVQGEYDGDQASGAAVRGIAKYAPAIGVHGQEVTHTGWAGYFDGDVYVNGSLGISDSIIKKNIKKLNSSLDKLMSISGYEYDFNTEKYENYSLNPRHQYGVIAQEVEKVFPELVVEKTINSTNSSRASIGNHESMKIKTVNYNGLIPITIEAIKEQQKLIDILYAKNIEQQKMIDSLQSAIKQQKTIIDQGQAENDNQNTAISGIKAENDTLKTKLLQMQQQLDNILQILKK
ncbi:MAG: tail fiber domain-containing protein, partial [Bacteroidales bacterium]